MSKIGFCSSCGYEFRGGENCCPKCGKVINENKILKQELNTNWLITLLIAIFLGEFGVHRFINGKIGTGLLMLITFGGCGIWWLVDIILIATEQFTDANEIPVKRY
ncbi:MAG: NINE protein [Candidatus Muiribacteriota bacterium]